MNQPQPQPHIDRPGDVQGQLPTSSTHIVPRGEHGGLTASPGTWSPETGAPPARAMIPRDRHGGDRLTSGALTVPRDE